MTPDRELLYLRAGLANIRLRDLGKDGRCKCHCGDVCPLCHVGSTERCTKAELEACYDEWLHSSPALRLTIVSADRPD